MASVFPVLYVLFYRTEQFETVLFHTFFGTEQSRNRTFQSVPWNRKNTAHVTIHKMNFIELV